MLGINIALFSSIILAISVIVLKKSYKELNPSVAFLFDAFFGLIIWIPIGLVFGGNFEEVIKCFPYAIISAILSEALVFYALSKGNLSITSILVATYPVYTLIFSFVINREILSIYQIISVIIVILGSILASIEKDAKPKSKIILSGLAIPVITAIAVGFSDTISKNIIDKTSSFSFLIAIAIAQIPISIIYFKLSKQKFSNTIIDIKNNLDNYRYAILGGLFNILGTGGLLISFNYALASIASPITGMYSVFVSIYAIVILKERISKTNKIGILVASIGLLGILILGS